MFYAFIFVFAGLLIYSIVMTVNAYRSTTGTIATKLAAAWRGSMTVFVFIYGTFLEVITQGLDGLAAVTGYPEFQTLANQVQGIIPAQYHPVVPVAVTVAMLVARTRTLAK